MEFRLSNLSAFEAVAALPVHELDVEAFPVNCPAELRLQLSPDKVLPLHSIESPEVFPKYIFVA